MAMLQKRSNICSRFFPVVQSKHNNEKSKCKKQKKKKKISRINILVKRLFNNESGILEDFVVLSKGVM